MFKGKYIRRIVGILGILVIIIPLSGFPRFWKELFEIALGALIVLTVSHRAILFEFFRVLKAFHATRSGKEMPRENNHEER